MILFEVILIILILILIFLQFLNLMIFININQEEKIQPISKECESMYT